MALGDLQAIAFGRGPGSFTGLRTACAVAQGLAFGANAGAGVPVLPIDTLMAVAEEARLQSESPHPNPLPEGEGAIHSLSRMRERAGVRVLEEGQETQNITALLDARMDEMYVQRYACSDGVLTRLGTCELIRPEALLPEPGTLYAGNVFEAYSGRLPEGLNRLTCLPTATAMLRLTPRLAASGHCVTAALALPLYVRDKVAQTTQERELAKALKLQTA
jgi:tRNA threonylcarbamoyladenosine biosynthesis protein TsaB